MSEHVADGLPVIRAIIALAICLKLGRPFGMTIYRGWPTSSVGD